MLLKAAGCIVSYWFEQMNYTYKKIWLIAFPVMMSILIEQLINITDALFLGHVGDVELGASALAGIWFLAIYMLGLLRFAYIKSYLPEYGSWQFICLASGSV